MQDNVDRIINEIQILQKVSIEHTGRITSLETLSIDERLETIIKKHNQTLMHISAELEAIKQCDPFNSVFIAGSIENISNIINGETDPIFDEGCIGCAGPCNVVDVAAKLQEELESTRNMYQASSDECCEQRKTIGDLRETINNFKTIETRETDRLHKLIEEYKETIQLERIDRAAEKDVINRKYSEDLRKKNAIIEYLKDSNIKDLKELYDIYEGEIDRYKYTVSARDLTIKSLTTMCQSSGTERNKLTVELRSVKADYDIMRTNHYHSVAKLQGDIGVLKERIEFDAKHTDRLNMVITSHINDIRGLEAELSARKEDSAVLMKVVDVVNDDTISRFAVPWRIRCIVEDYLDAPEGPPETPIDDLYKVTVSYTILEMP